MSSSFPNGFNSHGEGTTNLRGPCPFTTDSSFRSHESNAVPSMFTTSNLTNQHGLFSPSPSVNRYQNSHASSSSFGFNNPQVTYQMRKNTVSNHVDYIPVNNNPLLSRVSITQTIINRYSAIVPTSSIPSQNGYDRATNPNILNPNSFYSPNFAPKQPEIFNPIPPQRENLNPTPLHSAGNHREIPNPTPYREIPNPSPYREIPNPTPHREILNPTPPLNVADNQREILNPTPLNSYPPHQTSEYPRHVERFSFPPNHDLDQHVPRHKPVKKRTKPTPNFKDFADLGFEEDGEYDGRIHSLPCEKYGPYTCPKCKNVFDTSQKFAAHVSAMHYKSESIQERAKRYMAKNKNKMRKLNQMFYGGSQEVQAENGVEEVAGGNNNPARETEAYHHPIIKEEPSYM